VKVKRRHQALNHAIAVSLVKKLYKLRYYKYCI